MVLCQTKEGLLPDHNGCEYVAFQLRHTAIGVKLTLFSPFPALALTGHVLYTHNLLA